MSKVLLSITKNEDGSIDCIMEEPKEVSAALAGAFYESEFLLMIELALATFFGAGDVNPEPFIDKLRKDADKAARIAETIKD